MKRMVPDPSLIHAIEAAAQADPSNVALQIHLAQLLVAAERNLDALKVLEDVLRATPDNIEALGLAATTADALGDPRAEGWSHLYRSLGGDQTPAPNAGAAAPSAREVTPEGASDDRVAADDGGDSNTDTDWDGLLRDVLRDAGQHAPVTLADVGGLREVKERLQQSFLAPLNNPELRRAYGARLRGGLLLWGPPGCGKTFLARAIAGEMGAEFLSVGLHQVLDMWLGNSEKQLHEIFEFARRNTPCVLFFDEVDAIGHSRMSLSRGAMRNVVAQLLSELDGVEESNEGIFVIGATNQPWDVDPALRRPGRFDRTMLVLPPDTEVDPPPISTSNFWRGRPRECRAPTSNSCARKRPRALLRPQFAPRQCNQSPRNRSPTQSERRNPARPRGSTLREITCATPTTVETTTNWRRISSNGAVAEHRERPGLAGGPARQRDVGPVGSEEVRPRDAARTRRGATGPT